MLIGVSGDDDWPVAGLLEPGRGILISITTIFLLHLFLSLHEGQGLLYLSIPMHDQSAFLVHTRPGPGGGGRRHCDDERVAHTRSLLLAKGGPRGPIVGSSRLLEKALSAHTPTWVGQGLLA